MLASICGFHGYAPYLPPIYVAFIGSTISELVYRFTGVAQSYYGRFSTADRYFSTVTGGSCSNQKIMATRRPLVVQPWLALCELVRMPP